MMRRAAVSLVVLLSVAGCATRAGSQPSSPQPVVVAASTAQAAPTVDPAPAAAQATVTAYFAAIASHHAGAAHQHLAPEYAAGFGTPAAFDSWVANYVSVKHVTLRAAQPPPAGAAAQQPGYRGLVVIPVHYDAVLAKASGNEATGPVDRFVLVGHRTDGAPWLILDITSSP